MPRRKLDHRARVAADLTVQKEVPPAAWVPLEELVPWADNPRKNDGEPVARIARSIKRFGFSAPIVARLANKEIIAGHTRWKAAKQLGLKLVPVRFLDLPEREAHVLALKDNRDTELTPWDESLLDVLDDMPRADVEFAGWDDAALAKLEKQLGPDTEADEPPPVQVDNSFAIVISCRDEDQQADLLQEFQERGLSCRALL